MVERREVDPTAAAGFPEVESTFNIGMSRLRRHEKPAAESEKRNDAKPDDSRARRYVLESELGRGGMGVVYRVFDTDLQRALAMKVAQSGSASVDASMDADASSLDPQLLARFLEEAQVTGQLDHPGIVPLHELGIDARGRVYFTMRLIKGQHFGEVIDQVRSGGGTWTQERAIGVLIKVCEAMAYAHNKGVVHRDLKPANVMTGRFGEVYVMDWGLAKARGRAQPASGADALPSTASQVSMVRTGGALADDAVVTLHGSVFGTPAYMSPEQARGDIEALDARSDVYSTCAMLYHLLAGHPPYLPQGTRVAGATMLRWVIDGPPKSLREISPRPHEDLIAICEKGMSREALARYPDMLALAEDLRNVQRGLPVSANPLSAAHRTLRWCRRSPFVASVLVALTLGAAVGFWSLSRLSTTLVNRSALDSAATEARMLEDVNALYSDDVVKRVDRANVTVTHDYANVAGAIPLPATFLTTLADRISEHGTGNVVRHYSDQPFLFRKDGGPRDAFEREALEHLRADPMQAFYRFEPVDGRPSLRYATARRMKASCVECHNAHPDSPRHDWKEGDVRGVLEIVRPLDQDVERTREGVATTFLLVGGLGAALVLLCAFVLVRQSRASVSRAS